MIRLECLGAKFGDCIVLHYENGAAKARVLFDGGPPGVYSTFLKPWLDKDRAASGHTPRFALGMVTHIDKDHINGLMQLTDEAVDKQQNGEAQNSPAKFDAFWFNSFTGLTKNTLANVNTAAITASVSGPGADEHMFNDHRSFAIIASVQEGHQLSNNLGALGLGSNGGLNEMVLAGHKRTIAPGLVFRVVGPDKKRLMALRKLWDKTIPIGELAATMDPSVPNLSSIVLLAEAKVEGEAEDKKILMTGDAMALDIVKWLEESGDLPAGGGKLKLDVLKMPHHGSARNVTQDMLERLPARLYIFSADGTHDNPDLETMDILAAARPDNDFKIVLASPLKTPELQDALVAKMEEHNFNFTFRAEDELSVMVEV